MDLAAKASELVDRYVSWVADEHPTEATRLGDHSRDAELPELTDGSLDRWARATSELRAEVDRVLADRAQGIDALEARGDLLQLADALDDRSFQLEHRQRLRTDPLVGLDLATDAVHELLRRARRAAESGDDTTPWLSDITARLHQVPRMIEQAAALLTGSPRPHRVVALGRIAGARALFADHVPAECARLGGDAGGAAEAGAGAAEAMAAYGAFLEELGDQEPLPWRLGARDHAAALRTALGTRMPADQVRARAEDAFRLRRERLAEAAGELWSDVGLTGRPPADPDRASRAVLQAVADDVSPRDALVADAREAVTEAVAWCRAADVIDVPDTSQLAIEDVPAYQQGLFVAYLMPAPPLEPDAGSTYFLSPIPTSWSDERAASFLREYNRSSLKALAVHEAYPGHFLQLERASRHPRLARRLLGSSAFAEGWAVYAEHLVQEVAAQHGDDPVLGVYADARFRLVELKMQLRVAANALLDTGLHAGDLDDEGALRLMTAGAFQEEAEAAGKLVRAKVTCGQLCSYFVGGEEVSDLRRDVEAAWGGAFTLRRFHEAVLAHGTPPVSILRSEVLAGRG